MKKNNVSFIFHTSGTTGEPKAVTKSSECLTTEGKDLANFFKFSKDTIFVTTVTDNYMYGTTFTVMLPRALGCKVEHERVLYPEDIKDFEKFVFVSTPSFLEKLAKYNYKFKNKPEMIISAGAKLNNEIFKYLETISNGVTEIYGSTEAGVIAYRQSADDNFCFFENVKYNNGKITSPYFDEPELDLNDELGIFEDGSFIIKGRNDRIVKIQEKRVSLVEMENIINSCNLVEKSYCLKLDDKLCAAAVLNSDGRKFLEKNGKLELTKTLKEVFVKTQPVLQFLDNTTLFNENFITPKKWRFLPEFPINNRGKINSSRIKEIFNTNATYPDVTNYIINNEKAELDLIFPKNCNFFKGHFPNFPILPGVVQLFYAKEFIKDIFNLDFMPEKVKKIKFSSIIKPEMKIKLLLVKNEKSVDYKFIDGEKTFSSGTFVL